MSSNLLLVLSLLLATQASSPIACQQILQKMYHSLDFDPSKRLLLRLLPLLTPQQRDFLKSLQQ